MMMGIQGSSMMNMQQTMESFHSGKTNLSKEDVLKMEDAMASNGIEPPDDIGKLSEMFDEIDKNGDGISIDEMESFHQSIGMSFGPGQPPPGMFGNEQGGKPPMGKEGGPPPPKNEEEEDDEKSYIDKLIESYSSYDYSLAAYETLSFSA